VLETDISMNLHVKESEINPYRRMKDICLWSHIVLNIEINMCMYFFPSH